jgi:hypothetical protein
MHMAERDAERRAQHMAWHTSNSGLLVNSEKTSSTLGPFQLTPLVAGAVWHFSDCNLCSITTDGNSKRRASNQVAHMLEALSALADE